MKDTKKTHKNNFESTLRSILNKYFPKLKTENSLSVKILRLISFFNEILSPIPIFGCRHDLVIVDYPLFSCFVMYINYM